MIDRSAPTPTRPHQPRRAGAASVAGTVLEYYDFAIYGLAAALVFGPVFFPTASPTVGLLSAFATFGVGFVARPLGGILFGHLGDRIGRKNVLSTTLVIMGTATVLIGCLPGYTTIGYWAPALLVALRLLQGLAFGGELGGAVLLASEHADPRRRGFYSSLPNAGISVGLLLGNLAFLAISRMEPAALLSWGWRIPFWAGALLVVIGWASRRSIAESPEFQRNKAAANLPSKPLVEVLRDSRRQVLLAAGIVAGISSSAYAIITYSLSFAKQASVPSWQPLVGILAASALHMLWIPFAGALSDRFGRVPVFVSGTVAMAAIFPFFFSLLTSGSTSAVLLVYLVLFGAAYGAGVAVYPVLLTEAFRTRVAYSGISLGMQLGNIVGGFTPFLATLVVAGPGASVLGLCLGLLALISAGCAIGIARVSRRGPAGEIPPSDDDRSEVAMTASPDLGRRATT